MTEKESLTTIAVALLLVDETMNHKPLIISGSNDFIRKVLDTAIFENLPVSFADKKIQTEFRRQKEKKEIERRNFIANGGKILQIAPICSPLLQLLNQENRRCYQKRILLANTVRTLCGSFRIRKN